MMMCASLLANQMPPVQSTWAPVVLMIVIGLGFALGNVVLSAIIGPRRQGDVKSSTYESGMVPIGDTHKRFNVRFYVVAMIFLVFDVEIVFLYPFATIFGAHANGDHVGARAMLVSMAVFFVILLLAYVYAWGKGVFKWD